MPLFKSFVLIPMLIVQLFVGSFLLSAEALAQNEVLSQAAISEYTEKLVHARNIQAEIADRLTCLEKNDAELTSQNKGLEIELGNLRRREQDSATELAIQQSKQKDFKAIYESEWANYVNLQGEVAHYQAKKWAQEEAVRQCKRQLSSSGWFDWLTDPACDLSNSIAHLVGAIETVDGKIAASERKLQIARDGMNDAQQRLDESQKALVQAQQQAEQFEALARRTENEIHTLKATLSGLRIEVQNYRNQLDDFENVLKEAASVDTADALARTARKVIRISDDVDKAVARVADPANSVLPEGWKQSCSLRDG